MISEGTMALRMFSGMPSQPMNPKVQMMAKAEVMIGTTAARVLFMKNRIETTSTRAERGPSN